MFKIQQKLLCCFLFIIFFAGCAKYNPHPLCTPDVRDCALDEENQEISMQDGLNKIVEFDEDDLKKVKGRCCKSDLMVEAHVLSESDCRYYFSRKIISKGYRPVQLFIKNNSLKKYVLDTSSINLQLESRVKMEETLHLNMNQRVLGWSLTGLFIPAVFEWFNVPKVNKELDDDFVKRVLDVDSKYEIHSGAALNKVFFVKDDEFEKKLRFKLTSQNDAQTKDFGIIL